MRFDDTGKASFDHIYTEPDPRAYFRTLRGLEYCIPQLAKPHFDELISEYRVTSGVAAPQVVDIGSSYGINAALLRCGTTMDALYDRYGDTAPETTDELLARDRDLVAVHSGTQARFVGLDVSEPALTYAVKAGFLDDVVLADLESNEPTAEQRAQLRGTDLVISTGCLGYVGVPTISRVVTSTERTPWMAHFVLRMFPFDAIAEALAGFGYRSVRAEGSFRQRRFASTEEQEQVLDTLAGVGIDPSGWETDGWFYAQLYVCRPVVGSPGD
ncbi:MAG TPA: class I SAM-dependent methyltransferase [Pseudonocardiaceae bacterium]|nr:class I SAM-dependent methyltransferase [Pseudonocardiaceae bacterium]